MWERMLHKRKTSSNLVYVDKTGSFSTISLVVLLRIDVLLNLIN